MSLNILEEIEALPVRGDDKCKIARWLDTLPPDTEGLDRLVSIIETTDPHAEGYRPLDVTLGLLRRLGLSTSDKTLGQHRRHDCRCYR